MWAVGPASSSMKAHAGRSRRPGDGVCDVTSASAVQNTTSQATAGPGVDASDAADRLRLKADTTIPTGQVDGGWWPHSKDLAAELPDLFSVLAPQIGPIETGELPPGRLGPGAAEDPLRRGGGPPRRLPLAACRDRGCADRQANPHAARRAAGHRTRRRAARADSGRRGGRRRRCGAGKGALGATTAVQGRPLEQTLGMMPAALTSH